MTNTIVRYQVIWDVFSWGGYDSGEKTGEMRGIVAYTRKCDAVRVANSTCAKWAMLRPGCFRIVEWFNPILEGKFFKDELDILVDKCKAH